MKKSILTLALAVLLCLPSILIAQQAVEKYIVETEYLLYLPENYDADTTVRWPLVVFLHGAGETGSDIDRIKLHGLPKLIEQGMQFPFVAVSPQAKTYGWDPRLITEIVDQVARKYRLDSDRYYLTGLSMGGFGTWSTAQSFPGFFAAIVPICGGGFPQIAYVLSKTAVWNFHGDADDIVSIDYSNEMIEAVREYNPEARYTVYPGVGHDSWTETYENPEVWQWLLSQRKHKFEEAELPENKLNEYTGTYLNENGMADIVIEKGPAGLIFPDWAGEPVDLFPAGDDVFFIRPESFDHIIFDRDTDGKVVCAKYLSTRGLIKYTKE